MSDHSLPKTVDPLKYADQNKVLEGQISQKALARLSEIVLEPEGNVDVRLEFDRDEQHLRVVKGRLATSLLLKCERCLEPVVKEVESEFQLGIVLSDEQAKNLPGYYEPLLVEYDSMPVYDVVEEELILSLPMFAYHDDCNMQQVEETPEFDDAPKKANPFNVLSDLKLKK
jgi:uncharacterized protein